MGRPDVPMKWLLLLAAAVIHLAVLLPLVGSDSFILDDIFRPYAEGVLDSTAPYASLNFEYPPGAIPVLALAGLLSDTASEFRAAFDLWMLLWDLGVLALLCWALGESPRRLAVALAIYSVGALVLGRLILARFDLVPAALSLAALALHARERGLGSGLALGAGAIVKGWPLAHLPLYLLKSRSRYLVLAGFAVPVVAGLVAVYLLFGEGPGSAFSYHAERGLQIESLAATPFLVAAKLGAQVNATFGSGSFNIEGTGVTLARGMSQAALIVGYLAVTVLLYKRRTGIDLGVTLITGWLVISSPVLSPQFLIWILPLAAYAFACHWDTALARACSITLVAVSLLTRLTMENYDQIPYLGSDFVWSVFTRNLVFVLWLVLTVLLALKTRTPSSAKMSR